MNIKDELGVGISVALGKRKMLQSAFKLQQISSFVPDSDQNNLSMSNSAFSEKVHLCIITFKVFFQGPFW